MDQPDNASDKLKELNVQFISKFISPGPDLLQVNSKNCISEARLRTRNKKVKIPLNNLTP